ncbi:hypothetical protein [Catellatospora methionotrophica]
MTRNSDLRAEVVEPARRRGGADRERLLRTVELTLHRLPWE